MTVYYRNARQLQIRELATKRQIIALVKFDETTNALGLVIGTWSNSKENMEKFQSAENIDLFNDPFFTPNQKPESTYCYGKMIDMTTTQYRPLFVAV